jgi:hypothetical protein
VHAPDPSHTSPTPNDDASDASHQTNSNSTSGNADAGGEVDTSHSDGRTFDDAARASLLVISARLVPAPQPVEHRTVLKPVAAFAPTPAL